jgi:hypothetical protein
MQRRRFILGLTGLFAAPAIIRPGLLMPVKQMLIEPYSAIGSREDLSDLITSIDPTETAFWHTFNSLWKDGGATVYSGGVDLTRL